jgi:hypothetical protein
MVVRVSTESTAMWSVASLRITRPMVRSFSQSTGRRANTVTAASVTAAHRYPIPASRPMAVTVKAATAEVRPYRRLRIPMIKPPPRKLTPATV